MALTNWSSFDIFISKTRSYDRYGNLYRHTLFYFIYSFTFFPVAFCWKIFWKIFYRDVNVYFHPQLFKINHNRNKTLYTNGSFSIRNELNDFSSFFVYSTRKVWIISINKYYIVILSNIYIYTRNCLLYLFLYIVWSYLTAKCREKINQNKIVA